MLPMAATSEIDMSPDGDTRSRYNQEAQGNTLLSLGKLAFALRQDDWAINHGFRKPPQSRHTRGRSILAIRSISKTMPPHPTQPVN